MHGQSKRWLWFGHLLRLLDDEGLMGILEQVRLLGLGGIVLEDNVHLRGDCTTSHECTDYPTKPRHSLPFHHITDSNFSFG
jgi:hypothetical protein